MISYSDPLEKALILINYSDRLGRVPRPVGSRQGHAAKVAAVMLGETAQAVYSELLARPLLFVDEADLLEALAERLGQPVKWRSMRLVMDGQWKEGKYDS